MSRLVVDVVLAVEKHVGVLGKEDSAEIVDFLYEFLVALTEKAKTEEGRAKSKSALLRRGFLLEDSRYII